MKNRYEKRERNYNAFSEKINLRIKRLVLYKFVAVFAALGIIIAFIVLRYYYLMAGSIAAFLLIYLYLNLQHDRGIYYENLVKCLKEVNQNGLKRLNGNWTSFPDRGEDLAEDDHFYAEDLDIVGQGSLFQYISSCSTVWGREKLKSLLFTHPENIMEIKRRQEAICELSNQLSFRQHLQGEGMMLNKKTDRIETIVEWGRKINMKLLDKRTQCFLRVLPALTLILIVLGYFHIVLYFLPATLILFQIILLKHKGKERAKILDTAYAFKYQLEPYKNMLQLIERRHFSSGFLIELKKNLYRSNTAPSKHLARLSGICGNISNRNNMFYFLFNILTLWDYQCEIALEKWKKECGLYLSDWFSVIGTFEALSSLSNLKHDNPGWAVPEVIETEELFVNASSIGHPLITADRVVNDMELGAGRKVILVTGSNMSGKSTFLRTLGLNLALAYGGAPVCARRLSCSKMNIYSCMRISDNLEKNISSFYAELLRIKMIVEAVKNQGRVFFLLDEIFKGTNSYDRHHAADVLIKKLAGNNSIGLVSTHDLELEVLERETVGQVVNYHFQEHYDQGEILFDYKLRPGVSKTRNAIYLIRALGIDIDLS